jgi:hypothetical protein
MATEQVSSPEGGVIENVPVLDLSRMKSPDEIARITRIQNVAMVLVPESLAHVLVGIPMKNVAGTIPVPDGASVKMHVGPVTMSGEALANPQGQDDVLVVVGVLQITSPVEKVGYKQLIVTGLVLAPKGSETALGAGITRLTGTTVYYAYSEGAEIKMLSAQLKLSGEALANPAGNPNDILIVAGQLLITSPVEKLGYQQIVVAGQLVAPRESEALLGPALNTSGQVMWYGGKPRFFTGRERFSRAFFELLDGPVTLVLMGHVEIEPDVPPDLLRQKVSEIALAGRLEAPRGLVPLLQVLTIEKHGSISVLGEEQGATASNEAR